MGGNSHEGVALYNYPEWVALRISRRKIECSQLGVIVCTILDILQSPVTQRRDGCLLLGKQRRGLVASKAQRVLSEHTGGEQVICLLVCLCNIRIRRKRRVCLSHVIPVLAVAAFQGRHELHERVIRPLILCTQRNGHEIRIVLAVVILECPGYFL